MTNKTKLASPIKRMDRLQAEMARHLRKMAGIAVVICEQVDRLPPGSFLRIEPEFRDAVEAMQRFLDALGPEFREYEWSKPRPPSASVAWMRSIRGAFARQDYEESLAKR
jgi:hypothetical protein